MASKYIPSFGTPPAKANGNNSVIVNKRGKLTRTVLRQVMSVIDSEGKIKRHTIFHRLRGVRA